MERDGECWRRGRSGGGEEVEETSERRGEHIADREKMAGRKKVAGREKVTGREKMIGHEK